MSKRSLLGFSRMPFWVRSYGTVSDRYHLPLVSNQLSLWKKATPYRRCKRSNIVRLSAADPRLFFWLASQFIEQFTDELLEEVVGVVVFLSAHGWLRSIDTSIGLALRGFVSPSQAAVTSTLRLRSTARSAFSTWLM